MKSSLFLAIAIGGCSIFQVFEQSTKSGKNDKVRQRANRRSSKKPKRGLPANRPKKYNKFVKTSKNQKEPVLLLGKKASEDKRSIASPNADINNHYLADIKYEKTKTTKSFIAIGEKWIVKNKPLIKAPTVVAKTIQSENITLIPSTFDRLEGWEHDNFDDALESFLNSCKALLGHKYRNRSVESAEFRLGDVKDWMNECVKGVEFYKTDMAKEFFETRFIPFAVKNRKSGSFEGKFTAYCEFGMEGGLEKTSKFKHPIYAKPSTCKNQSTCPTRAQIYKGAIANKGLEICWIEDPLDLEALQMQGSGIILLDEESFIRLSFGGTNQYRRINPLMGINYNKILPKGYEKNKKGLYKWMKESPKNAESVLAKNPSYLFFKHNNSPFARGSHSRLTPSRSIAIDPNYIPYATPIWIETSLPIKDKSNTKKWLKLDRLVIAQDTGASIKGIVRADIFLGHGNKASFIAHNLMFPGKYYILVPKTVANKITIKKKAPFFSKAPNPRK